MFDVDFSLDLPGGGPSQWYEDARKRIGDGIRDTRITVDLPDVRVPDRVEVRGDGTTRATASVNWLPFALIGGVVFLMFRRGRG